MNLRNRAIAFFVTIAMVLNNLLSPVSAWYGDRNAYAAESQGVTPSSRGDQTASKSKDAGQNAQAPQPSADTPGSADGQPAAPVVLKKTITVGKEPEPGEPDTRRTYAVQVTCDASAGIPEGAALEVAELEAKDERKVAAREQLALAEGDRVVAETYLKIAIRADGQEIRPASPVEVVLETANMVPTYSDAVEAVVLGERDYPVTVENLTGKRDDGQEDEKPKTTKLKLTTAVLGEFAFAAVAAPFDAWAYNGQTTTLLGPRSKRTTISESLDGGQTADGKMLLRTVTFQTDPAHAWHPALWAESTLGEGHDAAAGAVSCWRLEDGRATAKVFGAAGTSSPVTIASGGEYAFVLEQAAGTTGQAEATTPEGGSTTGDAANRDSVQQQEVSAPNGSAGAVNAVESTNEDQAQPEAYTNSDQVQQTVRQQTFTASDGRTYRVTVTADSSAGIPKGADLVVAEVTKGDADYVGYLSQSAKTLGVKATDVSFAKLLDISFKDPVSGVEYQPNEGVQVSVELMGGELKDAQGLGVVHFGDTVQPVAAAVRGDEVTFKAEGFSVYAVVGYTVDFHAGDLTYSIPGKGSIALSRLLGELKLTDISLAEVADVMFSDPTLVRVEKQEDDWLLTSLRPFTSEETLSIVLKSGRTVVVRVTDEGAIKITFTAEGVAEENLPAAVTLQQDEAIGNRLPTLDEDVRQGYRFDGWLDANDEPVTSETSFKEDTVLHAKFVEQVTVSFYDEGGTEPLTTRPVDKGGYLREDDLPNGPEGDNCTFKGWYDRETKVTAGPEGTKFSDNTSVYARYTVTVTFTVDGEPTSDSKTFDKGTAIGELPTVEVPAKHRFDGWHVAGKDDPITAETTFDANATATGSLVKQVTVTFKDGGATFGEPITIDKGTAIGSEHFPANPQHDNCRFLGWYAGNVQITATKEIDEDTEATAKYEVGILFVVDYGTGDDHVHHEQTVKLEKGVPIGNSIPQNPERTGYRFDGWYVRGADSSVKVEETTTFDENTTADAVFVPQYTINFVDEDGSLIHTVGPVDENTHVDLWTAPTKDKKRFDGWYDGDTKVTEGFNATSNRTLKARYVDTVTITFMVDGQVYQQDTPDKGSTQTPPDVPAKAGHRVDGWYDESGDTPVKVDAAFTANADRTLVAHYVRQYTVKFVVNDSANPYKTCTVDEGGSVTVADWPADPKYPSEPERHRFDGWYEGGTKVTEVTNVTSDRVLTARFVDRVKLTYKVGGNVWESEYKDKGERVGTLKQAPEKQGLHFLGWFTEPGDHHFTEDAILEQDVTVAAKYGHRVTFRVNAEDTEYVEDRIVEPNTSLGWLPGDPFKENHNFVGWQLEGSESLADKDHVPTGDENYVAKFEPISLYTVIIKYVIENAAEVQETKTVVVAANEVAQKPVSVASPASYRTDAGVDVYPDQPTVTINSDTLTQAHDGVVDITVTYKEPNTTYHVWHMLKNLSDEGYTLVEDETKQGLQDAVVTAEPKEIANAEYEKVGDSLKLTGNVNQGVYAYYTRKSYTLIYNVNGGTAIKPVTAPFKSEIELPTPTREGYSFQGWYRDANLTQKIEGNKIVLEDDTTVYAKWEGVNVNYTIVYLFEKYDAAGENPTYEYDNSETMTAKVGTTVRATDPGIPDKTRERWEKNTEKNATSSVEIKADGSSVLNVYYKLKEYTFNFVSGGFVYTDVRGYGYNRTVEATKNGSTYTSGFLTSLNVKFGQRVAADWPLEYQRGRYVTRTDWWGNPTAYQSVDFYGWEPDNGESSIYVTKRFTVTEDMLPKFGTTVTYTALWLENIGTTYTVNYYLQNADNDEYTKSPEYSQTYKSYSAGLSPKDIGGYTFVRRSDSGNTYNFYYNRDTYDIEYVYGSTTLKTIKNVKFDANISGSTYNYTPENPADKPATEYSWGGWCIDEGLTSSYTFGKMPMNKLRLYAKWIPNTYTVQFRKNYPGATEDIPDKMVETGSTVSVDEPTRQYYTFEGWYTSATDCTSDTRFTDGGTPITASSPTVGNTKTIYANWTMNPLQYEVKYLDKVTGESLHMSKIRKSQVFELGQTITENAINIPGFLPDKASDSIKLAYEPTANVITFKYSPKPAENSYTVKYVVKGSNPEVYVRNPGVVTKNVNGSYETVTETALAPNVEGYEDYVPEETSIQKQLSTDQAENVITFNYVPNGAKVSISYVDMEGEEIKDPESGRYVVGSSFDLVTDANGYVLDHIENNVGMGDTDTHYTVQSSADINIKIWFKKRLTIRADSKQEQWRKGISLTNESSPDNVTVDGLKDGHTLSGITLTGAQTQVGVGFSEPSAAMITGMKPNTAAEVDADQFYSISYRQGTLTLTKANVTIRVEPDRWTGNIYTGDEYTAGFTNTSKTRDEYIIINNDDYRDDYRDAIWNQLTENDTNRTIIAKTDAGDYTVPATDVRSKIQNLPTADGNYDVTLFVRECRLEIKPAQLSITTGSDSKTYDGEVLVKNELTLTVGGEDKGHSGDVYNLVKNDKATVRVTGSQLNAGTSLNTYEITWDNAKSDNYVITTENLGTLEVKPKEIAITADDKGKPYHVADPAYTVTVADGETVIPNSLARWVGNDYTLKLQDAAHPHLADIPLTITRDPGEELGEYTIRVAQTSGTESSNYIITTKPGTLYIAIARVSNDGGSTWTYHAYLVNNAQGINQGAFNRANQLTNAVIVETLLEQHERYTLNGPDAFTFNKGGQTKLLLRTTQERTWNPSAPMGTKFRSVIKRGYSGRSMLNMSNDATDFEIRSIILDGDSENYYSTRWAADKDPSGGALIVNGSKSFKAQDILVRNCTAHGGNGAGICVQGSKGNVEVNDSEFDNCQIVKVDNIKGYSGGGIYFNTKAQANGITVTNCHADVDKGGGVYFFAKDSTLGSMYLDDNGVPAYKSSTFENCTAMRGGAINFYEAGGKIEGTAAYPVTFTNCRTTSGGEHGGGVAFSNSKAGVVTNATFTNCTANQYGGGISFTGAGSVTNVTVTGCQATRANNGNGGGVYSNGALTAIGCTISGNAASGNGGGIYANGALTSTGCTVSGNTAVNGGGIFANNTATATNCTVSGNTASGNGGGIYANNTITTSGGSVSGNTATGNGGGIYANGALTASASNIATNTAAMGGGVYGAANVTLKNTSTVKGNKLSGTTATNAAGIYMSDGKTLVLGDGTQAEASQVTGNTTSSGANSNVRLWESDGVNNAKSVSILSTLSPRCKIYVVNAKQVLTRFGEIGGNAPAAMPVLSYDNREFVKIFEADDGSLFGCIDASDSALKKVHWFGGVCKITNANGDTLKFDSNKDAVFTTLLQAFQAIKNNRVSGTPRYIKMLVEDYTLKSNDVITTNDFNPNRAMILTTASATDAQYPYRGTTKERCTIVRDSNNSRAMFSVPADGGLTIRNLVVDGNNVSVNNNVEAGLINVAGNLTLGVGAELQKGLANKQTNSGRAGAVYVEGGGRLLMTDNSSIHDCTGRSSGAVYVADGTFTMEGDSRIYGCQSKRVGSSAGGSGGAVTLGRLANGVIYNGAFVQQGNSVIENCLAEDRGGAVFAEYGTHTLRGNASIKGCTAVTGAGIYLSENTALKLSGSPSFGDGSDGNVANTVIRPDYVDKTNGGTSAYAGGNVRQDIYIAGYNNKDAASLQVVGQLTSPAGSIWVWAEQQPHLEMLQQFAQFTENGTRLENAAKESSMKVFRNARADDDTKCSGDYLTGQAGAVANYIYWTGGFDVTFLKTDGYGNGLNDATFSLYRLTDGTAEDVAANATVYATATSRAVSENAPVIVKTTVDGQVVEKQVAGDGLATFEKVSAGFYIAKETTFPKVDPTSQADNAPRYFDQYKNADGTVKDENKYTAMRKFKVEGDGAYKMWYAQTNPDGTLARDENGAIVWKDAPITNLSVVNGQDGETVPVLTFMNISSLQRKVILRKVSENEGKYDSLMGATFRVYYNDWREIADQEYPSDVNTGVYFVDTLPYGRYRLVETVFPNGYAPDGFNGFNKDDASTYWYYDLYVGDPGQEINVWDENGNRVKLDGRGTYVDGLKQRGEEIPTQPVNPDVQGGDWPFMVDMPADGTIVSIPVSTGEVYQQSGVKYVSASTTTYNLSIYYCPTLAEMQGNFIAFTGKVLGESDIQDAGGGNMSLHNVNSGDVYLYDGSYYMVHGSAEWIQTPDKGLDNWILVTGKLF